MDADSQGWDVESAWLVSLPAAAHPRDAPEIAKAVLPLVTRRRADGQAVYFDAELNEALDPLRMQPALGLRCGRCSHGLGFIALKTQGAAVESGNKLSKPKRRIGGIYDLAQIVEHSGRFPEWVDDANAGKGYVYPTGDRREASTGEPQRRQYRCPCGATYTYTNTQLLRIYLGGLADGLALSRKPILLE